MKAIDFTYWLQGVLEITEGPLSEKQVDIISDKLSEVTISDEGKIPEFGITKYYAPPVFPNIGIPNPGYTTITA